MFVLETVLNTDCNLCCYFCFAKDKVDSNLIPTEKFRYILDNLDNITNEEFIQIKYYGGEVFLHQDRLIEHFKTYLDFRSAYTGNKSFELVIITNGTIYPNEEMLKLIKETNCNINVSLEINEEFHNKIRHYKNGLGSFNVVINNINKYHIDLGYRIAIQTVLSNECVKHMDLYLDFIDRYKSICSFVFIPMFGVGEISDDMLNILPRSMELLRNKIVYYFENEDRCPISIFNEMRSLMKYISMKYFGTIDQQSHCLAGKEQITLLGDKMYPCSRFFHNNMKFLEYRNLDHYVEERDKWSQQIKLDDECKWCQHHYDIGCIGRCLVETYKNNNTNITEVCKYNRIIGEHSKILFTNLKYNDLFIDNFIKMLHISSGKQISEEYAYNIINKLRSVL